jgi:hypothetical protein
VCCLEVRHVDLAGLVEKSEDDRKRRT